MQIDDSRSVRELRQRIDTHARLEYGDLRADELADQIDHLAKTMAGVARQSLELRDESLKSGPSPDRRGDV